MIFKNTELYNISEIEAAQNGSFNMLRVPKSVEKGLSPDAAERNKNCCGAEIRFNLKGDKAKLKLRMPEGSAASRATVLYGSIYSGWEEAVKTIYDRETEIVVSNPYDKEALKRLTEENRLPFDSSLIRIMLEHSNVQLIDIEGDTKPPRKEQTPEKKYLAYGSSITHGSIGLNAPNTYPNRTAELLGAELINLGFAGSARLEKCMADYIAERNDWDFATLEMGINVLNIEPGDYRERITYFIEKVAESHPDKKVFCIDIFYTHSDFVQNGRAEMFRSIMRETLAKLNLKNTVYINGLDVLAAVTGLSADLIHPSCTAIPVMAENLARIIRSYGV